MKRTVRYMEDIAVALFTYSRSERRGLAVMLALMAAVLLFVSMKDQTPLKGEYLARVDLLSDSLKSDYYARNFPNKALFAANNTLPETPAPRELSRFTSKPEVFIELNSADSAALVSVRGIGAVISRNILQYRSRLGGFVSLGQLREVYGITEDNFVAISKQFFVDSAVIQKIDINFATSNELRSHPYMTANMAARIMAGREPKGGWNNLRELTDNDILLPGEAEKLAPYLVFRQPL